jgi:predicted nuclease with TOPRIM domain
MSFLNLKDSPTLFGERLSSIICEDVKDYLSEVKEYITKIIKDLHETQEERDDLQHEVDKLRAERESVEADALRRLRAIPVDFIERFAKSSTSWAEARPFYEMLLDYAEDDRDIKQKARNIKAHHTRLKNTRSKQVFIQSKQTNINNPTFGSMYDIHDNDEVKAG